MKSKVNPLLLAAVLFLSNVSAFACLNDGKPVFTFGEYIDMDGSASEFIERFTSRRDATGWVFKGDGRETSPIPQNGLDLQRSVLLVREGRVTEAIGILEALEAKKPGKYETASNLGTAYELNGENEKALQWIREGMRRNPESHFGTEWLHVKILEAKIALVKDPDWLKKNTVLGLDATSETLSLRSEVVFDGQKISIGNIEKALVYQLHERIFFVKPPDATVGDLLVDLGRVFKVTRTPQHAAEVNKLAMSYGVSLNRKIETAAGSRPMLPVYVGVSAAIFLVVGFLAFFFRRDRQPASINLND